MSSSVQPRVHWHVTTCDPHMSLLLHKLTYESASQCSCHFCIEAKQTNLATIASCKNTSPDPFTALCPLLDQLLPHTHYLPMCQSTGRMLGNCPCWIKFQMQLDPDRIIMNNLWPTLWCQCHVTCITEKVEEFSKVTLPCFVFTLAFCSLGGSCQSTS